MAVVERSPAASRRRLEVAGQVQGVGFRPHAWRLANELGLGGKVWNDAAGATLEVQGDADLLDHFERRLRDELPPLARIDRLERTELAPGADDDGFTIAASRGGAPGAAVTPDTATCPDCLDELFDPTERRHGYAFLNCTQCGPRYTIADRLPYDRANTSMSAFALCAPCAAEYADPADRRFHAQPTACPDCGPRLALRDGHGAALTVDDPVAHVAERLLAGDIVALKGLGGYHLACAARDATAVARLRECKQREEKPFAVMIANVASLAGLVTVDVAAAAMLATAARPIVLLPKVAGCDATLPGVAPGIRWLGAMLPYTPLQWLLFHALAGRPAGRGWRNVAQPTVLVMTSANPHGEPLVIDDAEAVARLGGIADLLLGHDRPIRTRCDDSVLRMRDGVPTFLRRARGHVPAAIPLPVAGPSVLAFGGYLNSAACVTRDDRAVLSQHVGDLDNVAACAGLDEAVTRLCDLLAIAPAAVARDLDPDSYASRAAEAFAAARGIPCVAVQHHHAHVAAVAAEHGVDTPLIGVALDGFGRGSDGAAWGGELLRVDGAGFRRLGHLRPLPLPGGDAAAREPWRMAAATLAELGRGDEIADRFPGAHGHAVARMLATGTRCPTTSSGGRLFDAAAGLLGVQLRASFAGQAAMRLEGLAAQAWPVAPLAGGFCIDAGGVLDFLPLLAALVDGRLAHAAGAACFHATLAAGLDAWIAAAAAREGLDSVALGGGCFVNALLCDALVPRLEARGLRVLQAAAVPSGDGGLALGQAWVAICGLR